MEITAARYVRRGGRWTADVADITGGEGSEPRRL